MSTNQDGDASVGASVAATLFDAALTRLADALDALAGVDLTGMTDLEVEDRLRGFTTETRRAPVVGNALVAEAIARCLPAARRCSVPAYLRNLIRVSPGEARALERDALELVPARSLSTGELLPARRPAVAAAITHGAISTSHARLITDTLRRAPADVDPDAVTRAEVRLVRFATRHDPAALKRRCEEELDRLDPDGSLGNHDTHRQRVRHLRLGAANPHGMIPIRGLLTPETGAKLAAALSPLAAPQPSPDCPDLRTPEQRNHDALDALCHRALATGDLPTRHGLPAKVIVTITLDQLEARTGVASTITGGRVPVRDLLRLAADTGVIPAILDADGRVLHFGEEQRLATLDQRYALWIQDRGCTFQNCTIPAIWTQCAHGSGGYATTRKTTIDDLAPLCGHHHRHVDTHGWTFTRHNGRIWFYPPAWIDPDQTPRTNEHFKPLRDDEHPPPRPEPD